ncbi:retrovirus-related pol polyprotein from transposon TNT 1-94 [Tanacetum coccineum]
MTESPFGDSGFVVPVFSSGDDPIACLNKVMAFLTVVASSRFPFTNNLLITSSNPRNQATIQDGSVILVLPIRAMLLVQGEILQVDRQELLNATTAKTEVLDNYDSDCDDLSTAQAVLMANISNYGLDVISEVPHSETYLNDMDNQSVHALQDFEQSPVIDFPDNKISMDVPSELPKVSLMNASLKRLKFHFTQFDSVVKKRTTPNALEEENTKEENVNHDKCDLEPINKELENSVAKLLSENERLCNKINHVKQVFKDQFDSIKQTRVRHKEQWKEIVENVVHTPSVTTIAPGMFKLDLVPLPPRELDFACKYATRIQELLVYVQDTCPFVIRLSTKKVESSNTLDSNTPVLSSTGVNYSIDCGSKPPGNKKNDRFSQTPSRNKKNKVEAQLRKVNKTNHVVKPICDVDVKYSLSNANSEILCATCNKSMFDGLSKITKIVESKNANHSKPNQILGSTATDIPSSSSLVMTDSRMINLQGLWGYGDYQLRNVVISKVYYVEGVDLLSGSRDTNLYTISLDDMLKSSPIYLLSKASKTKSWFWHRRLSHLNFACALRKRKKSSHQPKAEETNQEKLYLLHMDLCGQMHVASINGKRYILVIVDDYSRFNWVRFLKTKDKAPAAIIKCTKNIQVRLNATIRNVRTDNGTEFVNQTLREWYENVGIMHQTSVARTPQQNGVVERRNQTLVEAARTMLIFSKALLFLWAEAINTACYTQNRSLIRLRYNKTPYELMQDKKPDLSFFHVFGSLCYPTNDHEDLGKFDAKADIGIFVGYAPAKKAFRIYNRRTRIISETIHVTFDELTAMASEQFSSGPGLHYMTPATSSTGLGSNPVSQQPCLPPIRDDWDQLFQPMFDEYFNPPTIVVSPVQEAAAPRAEVLADSPVSTSIDQDAPSTSIPSSQEHEHSPIISQGFEESPKTPTFHDDPLNESPQEDSTSQGSSSNVRQLHTPLEHLGRWTKDHPIANVIGDPSRSVSTRKQLETDSMWCYFDAFLTFVEPKNFKQAMTEPSWIDAMQEEIHEFKRLKV